MMDITAETILWILFTAAAAPAGYVLAIRSNRRDCGRIIEWLQANPGWHYGLDICAGAGVSRSTIYVRLCEMEDAGLVERRVGERTNPGLPRPLYRAVQAEE